MKHLKKILSDNGFFALAFGVVVVSLFAVIAISHIGVADTHDMVHGYQAIQQLHFMRSEGLRGLKVTEDQISTATGGLTGITSIDLGSATETIDAGFGEFTFKMKSKVYQEQSDEISPFVDNNVINISSYGRAYTGIGAAHLKASPVAFYTKKVIKNNTFAGFHYFTDNEDSINADLGDVAKVKFWGPDVIHGIVRSNTDIYIQQAGGGTNNGWPTFHDHVYTSGEILPYGGSGTIPEQDVFLDGFTENLPKVKFPENANEARSGIQVDIDPGDAILATVSGTNHDLWYIDRIIGAPDTVVVYNLGIDDDPDTIPREDSIGVQYITQIDTMWTPRGNGRVQNNSIFFKGELWVQGTFAGRQTWASQDTMYLTGDIILANTAKGQHPDGYNPLTDAFTGPVNHTDYVGLISEKSVLIQYGYRSPDDSLRIKNNCGRYEDIAGDEGEGGIYIYAAIAALGKGETSMQDGVFSFQYQHPHPGLIAREGVNIVELANFDLYNIRPYTGGWGPLHFFYWDGRDISWPPTYGVPYYGPLWPEKRSESFRERGTINLYGSVAQRRRGFVHRSGSDPINAGEWDVMNYKYGAGPSSIGIPNAPAATGSGVGYKKNYNYDYRFKNSPPPKFPQVHLEGGTTAFDPESWYIYRGQDAPFDLKID